MALSNQELLQEISQKSVLDIAELIKMMEEEFGVTAQAAAVAVASPTGDAAGGGEEEAKDEFDVMLTSFGEKKVNVIKVVRTITGLGLKEAKDLVESAPAAVKEAVSKADAEKIKADLEAAGASAELK